MPDPSVSPNAILRCRVILLSEDYYIEAGTDGDEAHALKLVDESPDKAEGMHIYTYDYKSPPGYEVRIGNGVLFEHDWCGDATGSVVQVYRDGRWKTIAW